MLIPVVILMFVLYRPFDAALFAIAAVAVAEYLSAKKEPWKAELLACLIPATYFLLGFWLVYEFNDIIVTFRFYGAYDHTFLKIDRYLLLGGSVSGFEHWAMDHLPSIAFPFAEAVYYGAFAQIGAAVILVGINSGMSRSLQLVGTILLSYYLSLCCFAFWPSHGPYLLCENHFQNFPRELNSYAIQQIFLNNSRALWRHAGMLTSSGGYYISFPCMHVTQPLIIIWFLRSSRRIAAVLLAYDLVLVPSILVLEWHYAVDLIGGVVIAALAIWIITGRRHSPQPLADVSAACS